MCIQGNPLTSVSPSVLAIEWGRHRGCSGTVAGPLLGPRVVSLVLPEEEDGNDWAFVYSR